MKTADIHPGLYYGYDAHPTSRYKSPPMKVKVLTVGVPRERQSDAWRYRDRKLSNGIEVVYAQQGATGSPFVVRPQQIVAPWDAIEAEQEASKAWAEKWAAARDAAQKANRPLRAAIVKALEARGFTMESYAWSSLLDGHFDTDAVLAGTKSISVHLDLGDLARLLGVEGEMVSVQKLLAADEAP